MNSPETVSTSKQVQTKIKSFPVNIADQIKQTTFQSQ